jgi:hypothetical protein
MGGASISFVWERTPSRRGAGSLKAEARAMVPEPVMRPATIGIPMARPDRTYTIDEANAVMPEIRAVLLQMAVEQARLERTHGELHRLLQGNGDPGRRKAAERLEVEVSQVADGIRTLQTLINDRGIIIRDLGMGLVDFPAERDGRRVWLCWRLADPRVAFWHGTDEGYASRRPW